MRDLENGGSLDLAAESTPLLSLSTTMMQSTSQQQQGDDSESVASTCSSMGSVQSIRALPGMKIRAHGIGKTKGKVITNCSAKEALQASRGRVGGSGHNCYWIDIDADARDADELRAWLAQLKLSSFFKSRLAEPPDTWSSQVIPLQQASLAMIRILPVVHDGNNKSPSSSSDEITHIAALNLPHLLVTFTSCDRSDTGGLYSQFMTGYLLQRHNDDERGGGKSSSSALLLAWLQWHMERTSTAARTLRHGVLQMDAAMDRDISSVNMDEIIAAKDDLLRILSVAEEQVECIEALAGAEKDTAALDFSHLNGRLGVLQATAGATARMTLRLEKHLQDLRHRHESHQHDRLNRRLAVLTVLSAIFLPLTLITGIWGMNFEYMPELQAPIAYPIALTFMISLALSMICYFQRTGWFD